MNIKKDGYQEYLKSPEWAAKREFLFTLRGRRCESCGSTRQLHIHHLTYKRIFKEAPEDLQILCSTCHDMVHKVKNKKKKERSTKIKARKKKAVKYKQTKAYDNKYITINGVLCRRKKY